MFGHAETSIIALILEIARIVAAVVILRRIAVVPGGRLRMLVRY